MNTTTPNTQYMVITDLDGTLLDHDNYRFEAAIPALTRLEQQRIPVIINSSKTASEIKTLHHTLGNQHPFISENGSAISIPKHYDYQRLANHDNNPVLEKNWGEDIVLGEPREKILEAISSIALDFPFQFMQYKQCDISDIVRLTGLSYAEAKQSSERNYSEPLQWLGSQEDKAIFIQKIENQGLHILQGGRFMHVMGLTDKGKASQTLCSLYAQHHTSPIKSIALGDSHNDIAMLQAADIAVVIRSPHHTMPDFEHPNKVISEAYGPEGWNECIQHIL